MNKIVKQKNTTAISTNSSSVSWRDYMPANYWSLAGLEEHMNDKGQWPVLRPKSCEWEEVENPVKGTTENKLVVRFHGNHPAMVMAVERCRLATSITGTADPHQWGAKLGFIELFPAIIKGKAQLSFRQIKNEVDGEIVSHDGDDLWE